MQTESAKVAARIRSAGWSSAACVLTLGLSLTAPLAFAGAAKDAAPFSERCRDGQKASAGVPVPCDVDGHADGTCTFGASGGKNLKVQVGKTLSAPNSDGVVGSLSCDRPAPIAPRILYPPGAAKPGQTDQ